KPSGRVVLLAVAWLWAPAVAGGPTVQDGCTVEPYVTGLKCPSSIAFSPGGAFGYKGQLFVADNHAGSGTIYRVPEKDKKVVFAAETAGGPMDIHFAPPGSEFGAYLYALLYPDRLERYDSKGAAERFAAVNRDSLVLEFGPGGAWGADLYHLDSGRDLGGEGVCRWDRAASSTKVVGQLRENLLGMAFGPGGRFGNDLYLAFGGWKSGYTWHRDEVSTICRLAPDGSMREFLRSPQFQQINQIVFDTTGDFNGSLFVTDYAAGKIFEITPDGKVTAFLTGLKLTGWHTGDTVFGPDGALYVADGGAGTVWRIVASPLGLKRSAAADMAVLDDGETISGAVMNERFTVGTPFGPLTLPAGKIVGMRVGTDGAARFVLLDRQVLCGTGRDEALRVKTPSGEDRSIPFRRIKWFSYRVSRQRPRRLVSVGPVALLRTGDQLAFDPRAAVFAFRAAGLALPLWTKGLGQIEQDKTDPGVHRAWFTNGSVLTGVLEPAKAALSFSLADKAEVEREAIVALELAKGEQTAPWLTRLTLTNADVLLGQIAEPTLTFRTEAGEVAVESTGLKELAFGGAASGRVAATRWDGSVLQGQLKGRELAFQISPGPKLSVPVAEIAHLLRRIRLRPDEVVQRVEQLMARLAAPRYGDREQATEELVKIGVAIVPLVEKHRDDEDPEIRYRVGLVLQRLRAIGGESPRRLPPPMSASAPARVGRR
ncbi:MAG TPA: hypothetical protein VMZ50_03720, partial [Phycisphaerae bacterium]|nr:hypothetical protein [Phycisphaerae bacterium]